MRGARLLLSTTIILMLVAQAPSWAGMKAPPPPYPSWLSKPGTIRVNKWGSLFATRTDGTWCRFDVVTARTLPYTCGGRKDFSIPATSSYRVFVGRATRVYVTATGNVGWLDSAEPWVRHGRYVTITVKVPQSRRSALVGGASGDIDGIHVWLRWD